MANMTATVFPKIMAAANALAQQRGELRKTNTPLALLALANQEIVQPEEALRIRESANRPININWLPAPTFTTAAARSNTHTGPRLLSATEALLFATIAKRFSFTDVEFHDNYFNQNVSRALQFTKAVDAIMADIETAGIAFIQANKSGVNINDNALGTWDGALDFFKVANAGRGEIAFIGTDNMYQNNYKPRYNVLASSRQYKEMMKAMVQGDSNQTNEGWQRFDEFDLIRVNGLTNPAGADGVSLWMPEMNFGAVTWIPLLNRNGAGSDAFSNSGIFGTYVDPRYPNIEFAMSIYGTRSDTSATGGANQDLKLEVELSIDYTYRLSPMSTVGETIVQAVAQMST